MRPNKKRRLSSLNDSDGSEVLTREIDLEILLRQRLAATIQSRMSWALLLQNSLENEFQTDGTTSFRDAAMEALDAIESPCDLIFSRATNIAPPPSQEPQHDLHTPMRSQQEQPRVNRIRNGVMSRPYQHNVKLLFIRDTTTSPPVIAKMACPDCSRGDFTNIQGLLNHCRLRHKKDYGSHDECMQKCAVIVPEEEIDWVLANGHELGGVSLPSLRRLFEIAVGAGPPTALKTAESTTPEVLTPGEETALGAHLTRTLGHHKDTPALAPFLGRSPKRRHIDVFDDESVDITENAPRPQQSVWRMPYTHRNVARPELDLAVPEATSLDARAVGANTLAVEGPSSFNSRFHIVARIVISDRSLWLSPERRTQANQEHTHRWMLSVDSPSYSLHITTFLAKMTLTCLTDPPPSTLRMPLVITGPPFSAVNTTDRPFLARLTLEWVGSQNSAMEVEHWVELDVLKAANPALGDEQVLDVELDRNTALYPIRGDYHPPAWESDGNNMFSTVPSEESNVPSYMRTLKGLLPNVPMTMKGKSLLSFLNVNSLIRQEDVKGRPPTNMPYELVTSPAHFRSLIVGRRKAIEWGRARALRDAYEEHRLSLHEADKELVTLTTADIYCWLDDEGLFPRPTIRKSNQSPPDVRPKITPVPPELFCSSCGLNRLHHPFVAETEPIDGFSCGVVPKQIRRVPLLDINQLRAEFSSSAASTLRLTSHVSSGSGLSACDLVAISDPGLMLAILNIVRPLKLGSFKTMSESPTVDNSPGYPLEKLGATPEQVTEYLAPYALMSVLTKSFIRTLIQHGIQIAEHDAKVASAERRTTLLMPSHISRGLSSLDQFPTVTGLIMADVGVVMPTGG